MYKITKHRLSQEKMYSYEKEDKTMVFFTEESPDYQTYLKWVAEGNIAEEVTDGN
jgi:hypothetical protein